MPFVDYDGKRVIWKVVFYGPGLSGKTTNLKYLAGMLGKSNIQSIAGEGERTVFFDYLPVEFPTVDGMTPVFKLYTAPGQVKYSLTRQILLNGVDGIIFVADSQKQVVQNNIDSLDELRANLLEQDLDIRRIPFLFQYNKQDLPNTHSPEKMDGILNKIEADYLPGIATTGFNVKETIDVIGNAMVKRYFSGRQEEILSEIKNMEVKALIELFKEERKLELLKWLIEHTDQIKALMDRTAGLPERVESLEKAVATFNRVLEGFNKNLDKLSGRVDQLEARGLFGFLRKKPKD